MKTLLTSIEYLEIRRSGKAAGELDKRKGTHRS